MKRLIPIAFAALAFASCDTLSNLPTNTSGGVFILNGNWQLTQSSDGGAQVGTVVNVLPVVSGGTVRTLPTTNTYCFKSGDEVWRSIRGNGAGGFTVNNLVAACNGTSVYKEATISSSGNNTITVTGATASGAALTQTWTRIKSSN